MRLKTRFLPLLICLLLLSGCNAQEPENTGSSLGISNATETPAASPGDVSPAPSSSPDTAGQSAPPSGQPAGQIGELSVVASVAYAFDGMLYGAVTYKNAGTSAAVLSEADFSFAYPGGSKQEKYTPFTGEKDVVEPGETACAALFIPIEGLSSGGTVTLNVSLTGKTTAASAQMLHVADMRLIQNYPNFATLSGRITNPGLEACPLNIIYVEFYDQSDALIGVWYFTRNALLQPGADTTFVVHLRSLPIPGLAENTVRINARALGI